MAQENQVSTTAIGNQFNTILEKSESYRDLKIVKGQLIQNLKRDVLSSISKIENDLLSSKAVLNQKSEEISTLKEKLGKTNAVLSSYTNKGPTITFLGIEFNKSFFNSFLSFILLGSIVSVVFFFFQFKKMNLATKHSKSVLNDLEEEYQSYKRSAIEREQKISRQLQDELNKQKKNQTIAVA
ncbi:hypothetical protein GCM10023230_07390 [Flavobacterium hankyongi]|uniref:tRNA (Guanine-N1)-methyltransferase n=2 Tax=Flavobacteriaceae TaxID=49546 RepID=A0ABP8ZMX5_9FLAO